MSTTSLQQLGTITKRTVVQASSVDIELDPPALDPSQISVRVTTGTAAVGPYIVTDAGGTAVDIAIGVTGVATLSADGKTLTFAAAVTGAELSYIANAISTGLG